jgi:hypothetical protein
MAVHDGQQDLPQEIRCSSLAEIRHLLDTVE